MKLITRYALQYCIAAVMIVFFYNISYTDDYLLAVVDLMIYTLTIIALIRFKTSFKDIDKS